LTKLGLKIRQGYSPKTVTNHLLCLQVILKQAVRWRLISRNPVSDCDRPRVDQPELHVLSEVEIARLLTAYRELEAEAEEETKMRWQIARTITFAALGTAMQRGELLALRWRHVHLLERGTRSRRSQSGTSMRRRCCFRGRRQRARIECSR